MRPLISRYLGNWGYNKFYFDARRNLQVELAKETLKITQSDLNAKSSGVFIERINNDTDTITDIFTTLIDYSTSVISALGIFLSTLFINPLIFVTYLVCIIILFIMSRKQAQINQYNTELQNCQEEEKR